MTDTLPNVADDPSVRESTIAQSVLQRAESADRDEAAALDVRLSTLRRRSHDFGDAADLQQQIRAIAERREARRSELKVAQRAVEQATSTAIRRIVSDEIAPRVVTLAEGITPVTKIIAIREHLRDLTRAAVAAGAMTPELSRVQGAAVAIETALTRFAAHVADFSGRYPRVP